MEKNLEKRFYEEVIKMHEDKNLRNSFKKGSINLVPHTTCCPELEDSLFYTNKGFKVIAKRLYSKRTEIGNFLCWLFPNNFYLYESPPPGRTDIKHSHSLFVGTEKYFFEIKKNKLFAGGKEMLEYFPKLSLEKIEEKSKN